MPEYSNDRRWTRRFVNDPQDAMVIIDPDGVDRALLIERGSRAVSKDAEELCDLLNAGSNAEELQDENEFLKEVNKELKEKLDVKEDE